MEWLSVIPAAEKYSCDLMQIYITFALYVTATFSKKYKENKGKEYNVLNFLTVVLLNSFTA